MINSLTLHGNIKGDSSKETKKRSHIIVEHLFALEFVQKYIDRSSVNITTDDELDAEIYTKLNSYLYS